MSKKEIKMVLLDIDGVVTNGKVLVDSQGKEIKQIDFKDLDGAFEIKRMGIKLGFVTKENTPITEFFRDRFQPDVFYNGVSNKLKVINDICSEFSISKENICYMGDGKYDIEGVENVGLGVCPADAIPEVKEVAQIVLSKEGGDGCIWELVQHLKDFVKNNDFIDSLLEHIEVVNKIKFDKELQKKILQVAEVITECYRKGGRVLLAGNGGSASDAQHIATELISRFYFNRPSLDAECLAGNMTAITAIGNDFSFDEVFSRQIQGKAREGDVFIGISTSGNSKNIINALVTAKKQKVTTIALLGQCCSSIISKNTDYIIDVPSNITPRIQECHILIGHMICEIVEKKLFSEEYDCKSERGIKMKIDETQRKPIEDGRRAKLKLEKPLVYEKIIKYDEKEKNGECTAIIDFCFDYKCNMNCTHCCNLSLAKKDREMTIDDLRDIAFQADALGMAQFNISGGEPLVFDNLDEIIEAINPEKFHISMSTNGLLLTEEKAVHLKKIGLDKVRISLDSFNEEEYIKTRRLENSYSKAIDALANAKMAGLQPTIQTVVTHQNCKTQDTVNLAKFSHDNGYNLDVLIARAVGQWEGKEEVLIDKEDNEFLIKLREKYPEVHRDTYPTYGKEAGCGAVNRNLHITKYGDVLPCVFIHISIGNVFEEPLKDIIERGFSIKWFNSKQPLCLSGEDKCFIRNYMSKFYGKELPISYKDVFTEEDYSK